MWAWFGLIPLLCRTIGFVPSHAVGIGEPLPRDVALEWARWCRSPRYLKGHIHDVRKDRFDRFQGRLLAVRSSDDPYATARTVAKMARYYCGAATQHHLCVAPEQCGGRPISHFSCDVMSLTGNNRRRHDVTTEQNTEPVAGPSPLTNSTASRRANGQDQSGSEHQFPCCWGGYGDEFLPGGQPATDCRVRSGQVVCAL